MSTPSPPRELPQVVLALLLRDSSANGPEVLLGMKKTGLGKGNIVGPGGKLEPGESVQDALVREVFEESRLHVDPASLTEAAFITYYFPARPAWDQESTAFISASWQGEPTESMEHAPEWFPLTALPVDRMWDDARYWLPQVLAGEHIRATFTFDDDCRTVIDAQVRNSGPDYGMSSGDCGSVGSAASGPA